jgi:hypothetical protein
MPKPSNGDSSFLMPYAIDLLRMNPKREGERKGGE